jgi:serine protease Do
LLRRRGRDINAGPYDDFVQIDAPVNNGNSGGPTFDMDGNVVGVNTMIFSPWSVGIAFDIPADTVKSVVAQLKDKGTVTRGWIGVQVQPLNSDIAESLGMKGSEAALVAEAQADSPAAKAGVVSGDVITAVDGHAVKDARDLAKQIGATAPGAAVKLTLWRKGEEKKLSVTLGELPKERDARVVPPGSVPPGSGVPRLGLTLAPAAQVAGSGSEGVVVTQVDPNRLAAEHGLKTGDVILDVGGKKVASPADVRDAIGDAQKKRKARRADAAEVERHDAVRRDSVRSRLTGARGTPPGLLHRTARRHAGDAQMSVPDTTIGQ